MAQEILQRPPPGLEEAKEKISVTEELCLEHGMLDRIILAMDHSMKKAGSSPKGDLTAVSKGCEMIKSVIDEHHMKFEEQEIYPKFDKDPILKNLSSELKVQHNEARKMVSMLSEMCKSSRRGKADMDEMRRVFNDFKDMMTAHAAREETVLFVAMEGTWSDDQLDAAKDAQEEQEKMLLGDDADEKVYAMLGEIESAAGIESLKDFTRRAR